LSKQIYKRKGLGTVKRIFLLTWRDINEAIKIYSNIPTEQYSSKGAVIWQEAVWIIIVITIIIE